MLFHPKRFPLIAIVASLLLGSAGCIFSPPEEPPPPIDPEPIPPPTTPENLIAAIQVIYNDNVRSAQERRDAYDNLFLPPSGDPPSGGFIFRFQAVDILNGLPESWGKDDEIRAHEALFRAQENGDVYSLTLEISHAGADTLNPQQPGRENWMKIFASSVNLRLLFNPNDGLEVSGGQADYYCAPVDDRWYIGEWIDRPRP